MLDSCVGCGLCGEVAHAAVLCPSFYRAEIISNPTGWDKLKSRGAGAVIGSCSGERIAVWRESQLSCHSRN